MSAFSRGLLHRPVCFLSVPRSLAPQFFTIQRSPPPRCFATSQLLRYASKKSRPLTKKLPSSTLKTSLQSTPAYQSFSDSLANKSHATLLYAAPPHTMYMISSYTAAFFCFSYAAFNFNAHYLAAPPDLATWVPVAFGGVCFLVACFGGWLALGPARLVKTIVAIPSSPAFKGAGGMSGSLMLEVELKKMLPMPFFPARKLLATPEEMSLNKRLYYPPIDPRKSAAERLEMRRKLDREQEEERRKSIWWAPFRHANKAFYELFRATRRAWVRDGFLELGVKGQLYKLDVTGGWALDDGKALDRLVRAKP